MTMFHVKPADRAPGRLGELTQDLPGAAAAVTQLIVDNPAQIAVAIAGVMVASRIAFNLMRPRSAFEALALLVMLEVALPAAALASIRRGWLPIRVRDSHGCLVPLAGADGPAAAAAE